MPNSLGEVGREGAFKWHHTGTINFICAGCVREKGDVRRGLKSSSGWGSGG